MPIAPETIEMTSSRLMVGWEKSESGTTGSGARRSTRTQPVAQRAPKATTARLCQAIKEPKIWPLSAQKTIEATAPASRIAPA